MPTPLTEFYSAIAYGVELTEEQAKLYASNFIDAIMNETLPNDLHLIEYK